MNFKDWCFQVLGIVEFTEGKILNCVFIPASSNNVIKTNALVEQAGGYIIESSYMRGIIIPFDNYLVLTGTLERNYHSFNLNQNSFQELLNVYFLSLGVDLTRMSEYKNPSSIHLTFKSHQSQINFLTKFRNFYPVYSFNPLLRSQTLQLPASIIKFLLDMYYLDDVAEIKKEQNSAVMEQHLHNLFYLKKVMEQSNLQEQLNYSTIIARDFTNSVKNGLKLLPVHAADAYALSLKIYAEVNRDNLSIRQYESLNYASSLLSAYTTDGSLKQSFKTDVKFVMHLCKLIKPRSCQGRMEVPLISSLPEQEQHQINSLIDQNLNGMLYGNPCMSLGDGSHISMARFLPGVQMRSNTDELIFQGGGMRAHSAIFRIIKVGYLANGYRAGFNDKPLFYEYYKVEDNLGDGIHELNLSDKTCTGTYITKLEPFAINNGVLIPLSLDPFTQSLEYQKAMECTLKELIRVERQIKLYRKPSNTSIALDFSIPGSDEANEWYRLDNIRIILSGKPHPFPIIYYSPDPLDSSKFYQRVVSNRRNYYQESGSCTVFTLKSFVSSVIGIELTTLHINFMQLNNAQQHVNAINAKMALLQFYMFRFWLSSISQFTYKNHLQTEEQLPVYQSKITFFGANQSVPVLPNNTAANSVELNF